VNMARKPRIHFPGALYHIISRGNRRQNIFREHRDYQRYLEFLKEYKVRYRFSVYAYALMPNHIHLLVEVGETPVSRVMQALLFRYTRNFNIKYRKTGHLFEGRYKAILCEKDSYLLELSAYVHLNPVRAGLAEDPTDYRWTSYRTYLTGESDDLVDTQRVLIQFSRKTRDAIREYDRFVKDRVGQGHVGEFYELKDQRFLGEDEFVEEVRRGLNEKLPSVYDITVAEIASKVSLVLGIPLDSIYSTNRNRNGALGRAVVGYLGRRVCGHQVKAVAEHFSRDPVAISLGMKKLEGRLRGERTLREAMEKIEKALTRDRRPKYLFTYA
jgi:putative transposase